MNLNPGAYPVSVKGELSVPPGRWKWLFKWILGIPHYICLFDLGIAFLVVWFVSFFAILFTGKYPKNLFRLIVGLNRRVLRVAAYAALMRDEYPPFRLWDRP